MAIPAQLENLKPHFADTPDLRHARGKHHELVDIIVIMRMLWSPLMPWAVSVPSQTR